MMSSSEARTDATGTDASSTTDGPGQTSTVVGSSETGVDTIDSTSGGGFIYGSPDTDDDPFACSVFEQNCREGERCSAWANDGGLLLNATRCVPLADVVVGVGEACVTEGSFVTGVSNCGLGLDCVGDDLETNEGTCLAYCNADNPCEAPTDTCVELTSALGLCEPS